MCEEGRERGVQKLVKMFETRFSFTHSHSADEAISNTGSPLSARMRRRSFAKKQKTVFRTTGSTSSVSSGSSSDNYSPGIAKTFNRKAALRRPSTSDNKKRSDSKVQFSFDSPGGFSPRTSLKRQKSISADSLAEIRSAAENVHREEHVGGVEAESNGNDFDSDIACGKVEGNGICGDVTNQSFEKGSPEVLLRQLLRRSVKKEADESTVHMTLDRTVSDSSGLTRQAKSRFVTFSTDVSEAETIRKLTRTPTPFWSHDSEEDEEEECVFDEQPAEKCPGAGQDLVHKT